MNIRLQILHILSNDEESRNDDSRLTCVLWKTFYPDLISFKENIYFVSLAHIINDLPKMDTISRDRRTIQNTLGLFPPTKTSVAKARKLKQADFEEYHRNNFNYTQAKVILEVYEGVKNKKQKEIQEVLQKITNQLKNK